MFLLWLWTTRVSYTQDWSVNILCISGSRAGQRQPGLYCLTHCVIYTSAFYSLADERQLCTCMHFCWKYTLVVFFPIFAFSSGEIEWTAQCTLVRVNRRRGASQHSKMLHISFQYKEEDCRAHSESLVYTFSHRWKNLYSSHNVHCASMRLENYEKYSIARITKHFGLNEKLQNTDNSCLTF